MQLIKRCSIGQRLSTESFEHDDACEECKEFVQYTVFQRGPSLETALRADLNRVLAALEQAAQDLRAVPLLAGEPEDVARDHAVDRIETVLTVIGKR